jgi:predicted nucleic-acid-binding protein
MIGLDTNILLRHFAQDDPLQSPKADAIFASFTAEEPGWLSVAALLELIWAATYNFGAGRAEVIAMLETLLAHDNLIVENIDEVMRSLHLYRRGNADFADCLISSLGRSAGCGKTLTFDRKAAKTAGMVLA